MWAGAQDEMVLTSMESWESESCGYFLAARLGTAQGERKRGDPRVRVAVVSFEGIASIASMWHSICKTEITQCSKRGGVQRGLVDLHRRFVFKDLNRAML